MTIGSDGFFTFPLPAPTLMTKVHSLPTDLPHTEPSIPEQPLEKKRLHEFDCVKAIAILIVILIHSINSADAISVRGLSVFLGDWTRFAVPWFLFTAGFLFNKDVRIPTRTVCQRTATRILLPYLCCSIVCLAYNIAKGKTSWQPSEIMRLLLLGNSHGIYYFVFVITYLYALGLLLRQASSKVVMSLWILSGLLMATYYLYWPILVIPEVTMTAMVRNPFIHSFPFLSGWVACVHYATVRSWLRSLKPGRFILLVITNIASLVVLQYLDTRIIARELAIQVHVYSFLIVFLSMVTRVSSVPGWVQYLSMSSYGIYLTHILFVEQIYKLFGEYELLGFPGRIAITFALATLLTIAFLEVTKRWTGRYTEFVLGVKPA